MGQRIQPHDYCYRRVQLAVGDLAVAAADAAAAVADAGGNVSATRNGCVANEMNVLTRDGDGGVESESGGR